MTRLICNTYDGYTHKFYDQVEDSIYYIRFIKICVLVVFLISAPTKWHTSVDTFDTSLDRLDRRIEAITQEFTWKAIFLFIKTACITRFCSATNTKTPSEFDRLAKKKPGEGIPERIIRVCQSIFFHKQSNTVGRQYIVNAVCVTLSEKRWEKC